MQKTVRTLLCSIPLSGEGFAYSVQLQRPLVKVLRHPIEACDDIFDCGVLMSPTCEEILARSNSTRVTQLTIRTLHHNSALFVNVKSTPKPTIEGTELVSYSCDKPEQ